MSHDTNDWQQQVWQQPTPPNPPSGCVAPQPPCGPSAPPPRRGWIVALVAVVLCFILAACSLWSCTSVMSSAGSWLSSDADSFSDASFLTSDAVAVISISGTIQYDGTTASPEGLKEQLDIAAENPSIKAVVLRIDSGGGSATAGEEMSVYVQEFIEETGKPVVVSSASINASAAYEISSQANYIFTAKTTSIGSIGTAMQITDYSGLLESLGISVENITSSDSKDSSYGTRSLTEEEIAYYQDMVDVINDTFIQTVADGRGMTFEEVEELATGLTFTGMEAVENGLADEIGTKEDAIEKAAELAGISDYSTVSLESSYSDLYSLFDLATEEDSITIEEFISALKELDNNGAIA